MQIKITSKTLLLTLALICGTFIYFKYDPVNFALFPKCPFLALTGYQCPGCGSQRAIHSLLHLNVSEAFHQNALLVLSLPYLFIHCLISAKTRPSHYILKWRKRLYGVPAIWLVFSLVILFWIGRNII